MARLEISTQTQEVEQLTRKFDQLSKAEQKAILKGSAVGKELDQSSRKGKRGFDSMKSSAKDMIGTVTGVAGAVGAITTAIMVAKREWEDFKRRTEEAARTQQSLTQARAGAQLQRPGDISVTQLDKMTSRISRRTGLTEKEVYGGLDKPLSAKGSASAEQFEEAMVSSGKIAAAAGPQQFGELASGVMDVVKTTGLSGKGAGEKALGFLQQFGTAARIEKPEKQARAIGPALQSARQFGLSPETGAEILATLTQGGVDPTGESGRTAAIDIINKIMTKQGLESETFYGRLKELQKKVGGMSEQERNKFFEDFGGEKRFKGAFRGLLTGEESMMHALRYSQEKITAPTSEAAQQKAQKTIQSLWSPEYAATRRVQNIGERTTEQFQKENPQGFAAALNTQMRDVMESAGVPKTMRQIVGEKFRAQAAGTQNRQEMVELMRETLESQLEPIVSEYKEKPGTLSELLLPGGTEFLQTLPEKATKKKGWKAGDVQVGGRGWEAPGWGQIVENPRYREHVEGKVEELMTRLEKLAEAVKQGAKEGAKEGTQEGVKQGEQEARKNEGTKENALAAD